MSQWHDRFDEFITLFCFSANDFCFSHFLNRIVHTLSSINLYENAIEDVDFDDLSTAICDPTTQWVLMKLIFFVNIFKKQFVFVTEFPSVVAPLVPVMWPSTSGLQLVQLSPNVSGRWQSVNISFTLTVVLPRYSWFFKYIF